MIMTLVIKINVIIAKKNRRDTQSIAQSRLSTAERIFINEAKKKL